MKHPEFEADSEMIVTAGSPDRNDEFLLGDPESASEPTPHRTDDILHG
ncbi:hypothetical protein OG967_47705 [Streptomyces phaeochromogenes]